MSRKLILMAAATLVMASGAQAKTVDVALVGSAEIDNAIFRETYNLCSTGGAKGTFNVFADYTPDSNATVTSSWGGNYKVYQCVTDATAAVNFSGNLAGSIVAGDTVNIHKTNFGGSIHGVAPFNGSYSGSQAVVQVMANNSNCAQYNGSTTTVPGTSPAVTVSYFGCSTSNSANDFLNLIIDGGISEDEPSVFNGINTGLSYYDSNGNPVYYPSVDFSTVATNANILSGTVYIWGLPVTQKLYIALQAAEGLLGYGGTYGTANDGSVGLFCSPGAYSGTLVSYGAGGSLVSTTLKDGCMPNLSKQVAASIISGSVTDWSNVSVPKGNLSIAGSLNTGATVNLLAAANDYNAHNSPSITPNSGTLVNFCQRTAGAGAAISQYWYFLDQSNNADLSPITNTIANVYMIGTASIMDKCLDDLDTGHTNALQANGQPVNTTGNTAWAMGQQYSGNNTAKSYSYRFVKVDGFAPTLENSYTSDYSLLSPGVWLTWKTPPSGRSTQANIINILYAKTSLGYKLIEDSVVSSQDFGHVGGMAVWENQPSGYCFPATIDFSSNPYSASTNTGGGPVWTGLFPLNLETNYFDDFGAPTVNTNALNSGCSTAP